MFLSCGIGQCESVVLWLPVATNRHLLVFYGGPKLLRPEQSCSQILQCWVPVESSSIKISMFTNVKIGKTWIPLFGLSRVVLLCPGCGDLHGSVHGLPLLALIQAEIGDQEPCRISGRVSWEGKDDQWCLWDVIIGCAFLSLHFLAVINTGDLTGKISEGII